MTARTRVSVALALWVVACSDANTPVTGVAPASFELIGNEQIGTAGARLAKPVGVRALDSAGRRIYRQAIRFRVIAGSGNLIDDSVVSTDSGTALTAWVLGTHTALPQQVEVLATDVAGSPLVVDTLTATPLADSVKFMTRQTGDTQSDFAGALLGMRLALRLSDKYGNPVPGATVTWLTQAGSGSVDSATVTSDAGGLAHASWTLGSARTQTLSAQTPGLADTATFTAFRSPHIVAMDSPTPNLLVGDSVLAQATITSKVTLSTPVASVNGFSGNLTLSSGKWRRKFGIGGAEGATTLRLIATDQQSHADTVTVPIVRDSAPPKLTVTSPAAFSIAQPSVHVTSSCVDMSHCTTYLSIIYNGGSSSATLLVGGDNIDQDVSLVPYDGLVTSLKLLVTDAVDRRATTTIPGITAVANAAYQLKASVPGPMLDADATRILWVDETPTDTVVRLRTRANGLDSTVAAGFSPKFDGGYLTSVGAILALVNLGTINDWRAGILTSAASGGLSSLKVSGQYAVWASGSSVVLRDAVAATTTNMAASGVDPSVASNGDAAYIVPGIPANVARYRGSTTMLTADGSPIQSQAPLTDGINVVYYKTTSSFSSGTLYMYGASGESQLAPTWPSDFGGGKRPRFFYGATNGWIAFAKLDSTTYLLHIMTRAPDGTVQEVASIPSQVSTLHPGETRATLQGAFTSLSDDGRVVFVDHDVRYVSAPPYSSRTAVGPSSGTVIWLNGFPNVILGSGLFELH